MKLTNTNINRLELKRIASDFPKEKIKSSQASYNFIKQFYGDDISIFESCFILLLDAGNNTIGYAKISQGGISGAVVDIRIIAKYAVESLAVGVILAHNHPSGNLKPSRADIEMTQKVKKGLKILDVKVLDHIILTENEYYSFLDAGIL